MTPTAGSAFGSFVIIEQLGRGGMASVFKAYETALDRYVALKTLPAEFMTHAGFVARFEREAKVIAKLEHPNIVPIFSYGIEAHGGIPWMAMRLVRGGSLSSRLGRGPLAHSEVILVVKAVSEALEYAHGNGVVHRDVKPQNVLLDEAGRVYLADFGIARMVEGASVLTQTGAICGTPYYMAPEQAAGGSVDARCDIYALGILAYELLVGTVPFSADTPLAVLMKHVSAPIPVPSPDLVPEAMTRALLKCLAKRPEERWQQATDFARALEEGRAQSADTQQVAHTLQESPLLPAATVVEPSAPILAGIGRSGGSQRRRALGAGVSLAAALGLSLLMGSAWLVYRSVPARDAGPTALEAPSLAIDLQVIQAVGAVTDTLSLRFEVDGRIVRELSLRFPPDEQPVKRESVVIEGLSAGSHHLLVFVSPEEGHSSSAVLQGDQDLNLRGGVNRLLVRVTFVGSDSSIQFQ